MAKTNFDEMDPMERLEAIKKRNNRIDTGCAVASLVVGVGIGVCSELVIDGIFKSTILSETASHSSKMWEIIAQVGCMGISTAVGSAVAKTMSEPIMAIGDILKGDDNITDILTPEELTQYIMNSVATGIKEGE